MPLDLLLCVFRFCFNVISGFRHWQSSFRYLCPILTQSIREFVFQSLLNWPPKTFIVLSLAGKAIFPIVLSLHSLSFLANWPVYVDVTLLVLVPNERLQQQNGWRGGFALVWDHSQVAHALIAAQGKCRPHVHVCKTQPPTHVHTYMCAYTFSHTSRFLSHTISFWSSP